MLFIAVPNLGVRHHFFDLRKRGGGDKTKGRERGN